MEENSNERRQPPCRNCEIERLQEQNRDAWLLVTNPATEPNLLDEIAHRAPWMILVRVAEHPAASIGTLERLSYHPSPEVRAAVAENLNTPTHIIFLLTNDSHADVRYSIAENHNTPTEALELLSEDENPYVAYRAQMTLTRVGTQKQATQLTFPQLVEKRKQNQAG